MLSEQSQQVHQLLSIDNDPISSIEIRVHSTESHCFKFPHLHFMLRFILSAAAAAESFQSCPTLCDPIDGSPPGSPVPGILQARTLEGVAISFSTAVKWKVKMKSLSRVWLLATPWTDSSNPWDFLGKSTGVACHCLLWKSTVVRYKSDNSDLTAN